MYFLLNYYHSGKGKNLNIGVYPFINKKDFWNIYTTDCFFLQNLHILLILLALKYIFEGDCLEQDKLSWISDYTFFDHNTSECSYSKEIDIYILFWVSHNISLICNSKK